MILFRPIIRSPNSACTERRFHTFLYASDTRKRYIHMYYSAAKAAGERARFEENIQQMQRYLDAN